MRKRSGMASLRTLVLPVVLGLAVMLGGCGDSGSAGTPTTGSVALVLTDAPTGGFVQVRVTVTRIDLLPGAPAEEGRGGAEPARRETIFEGRETIDLLALENVSAPFAIADDVPAGTYSKLRLEVEEIELVRMDAEGGLVSVFPRLPGGHRIDLNARGGFRVSPGETLAIRLDVDARRSIQIVDTGNGGYVFRPQVFVEILDAARPGRLIFAEGVVREIDPDAVPVRIRLCEVAVSHRDLRGRRDRHCLAVFADEETSFFDESGLPQDLGAIASGSRLAVLGRFMYDRAMRFAIDAEVLEGGGSDAFLSLTGNLVFGADPEEGGWLLDLDPGQGFADGTILEIDLAPETKAFSSDGDAVDFAGLGEGTRLEVDGVLVLSSDSPDLIRAAIVFVGDRAVR